MDQVEGAEVWGQSQQIRMMQAADLPIFPVPHSNPHLAVIQMPVVPAGDLRTAQGRAC